MTAESSRAPAIKERVQAVFARGRGPRAPASRIQFVMPACGELPGALQRLHATNALPGSGTGLATVHRVVHRRGERVRAEGQATPGASLYSR